MKRERIEGQIEIIEGSTLYQDEICNVAYKKYLISILILEIENNDA